MMKMTATVPRMPITELRIVWIVFEKSAVEPEPGQPEAARISADMPGQLQISVHVSAKTGVKVKTPSIRVEIVIMILLSLFFMGYLLCDGYIVD